MDIQKVGKFIFGNIDIHPGLTVTFLLPPGEAKRYADIAEELDVKVSEACKLMAVEFVEKARKMQPIPTLCYYRPELDRRSKPTKLLAEGMQATREAIKDAWGI